MDKVTSGFRCLRFKLRPDFFWSFCCIIAVVCLHAYSIGAAEAKRPSVPEIEQRLVEVDEILKKDPHNFKALEVKVASLQLLGRLDEGMQACQEAMSIRADSSYLWFFKGYCQYKKEKWKDALCSFEAARKLGDVEGLQFSATCLLRMKRYDDCVEFTNKAIQDHPEMATLYLNRGLARKYLKQSRQMVCEDLKKAADLSPQLYASYRKHCIEVGAK